MEMSINLAVKEVFIVRVLCYVDNAMIRTFDKVASIGMKRKLGGSMSMHLLSAKCIPLNLGTPD